MQSIEQNDPDAELILIVLSPDYKKKAEERPAGVGFEYSIVTRDLYEKQTENNKFVPILRAGSMSDCIPVFMRQYIYANFSDDTNMNDGIEELLRVLFDAPKVKKQQRGPRPNF